MGNLLHTVLPLGHVALEQPVFLSAARLPLISSSASTRLRVHHWYIIRMYDFYVKKKNIYICTFTVGIKKNKKNNNKLHAQTCNGDECYENIKYFFSYTFQPNILT